MTAPALTFSTRPATGPRGLPLVGVLPQVRRDVLGFLTRTAAAHGDVARYRLGPLESFLVSHPDGVRHVLQEHASNYSKDHMSYTMARWVAGNGLLTSQGSFWLRQRRLASPAFHRGRVAALGTDMVRATEAALHRWAPAAARGEPVGVNKEMMQLTFRIMGEALFGADLAGHARGVGAAFDVLSEQVVTRFRSFRVLPPVLPFGTDRAFRTALATLDATVQHVITTRRSAPDDRGDLLSMFMLARDEDTGEVMNDRQLRDELVTMMIAGHETTATTLAWVWALLAAHGEAEARLHAELDGVLGGRAPTGADLARLPWTRAVVDEAMRLFPPAYVFSRKTVDDDVIGGVRIPKGSAVDLSPWVTHRRADLWERPDAFLPERFLGDEAVRRARYAYFPFSGGPRQCIGLGFALMEAQLIVATVAQRYRLRPVTPGLPTPEPLITLRPEGGLPMRLERRSAANGHRASERELAQAESNGTPRRG